MKKSLAWILLCTIVVIFVYVCSGCSQAWYQRRDIKKLDALSIQQPTEFLRLSNQINPCFNGKAKSDTTTVFGPGDTVFKAGKEIIIHEHDTTYITRHDTLKINKQVTKTIHDTVPDTRAINSFQAQLTACSSDRDKDDTKLSDVQQTATTRLWWMIGLGVLIIVFLGIKAYLFFSGGAVTGIAKKII